MEQNQNKNQNQQTEQKPQSKKEEAQQVEPALYDEYCHLVHRQMEAQSFNKSLKPKAESRLKELEKVVKSGAGKKATKTMTICGKNGDPIRMVEGVPVPDVLVSLIPKSKTKYL